MSAAVRSIRLLAAAHVAAGSVLVLRSAGVAAWSAGGRTSHAAATPPTWVVRVLGVRYALQGVTELVRPVPEVALAGALADVLHAVSMVPAALSWPRYGRAARISGAVACLSAGAGAGLAYRGRSAPLPAPE
jgi:hypothetical protein